MDIDQILTDVANTEALDENSTTELMYYYYNPVYQPNDPDNTDDLASRSSHESQVNHNQHRDASAYRSAPLLRISDEDLQGLTAVISTSNDISELVAGIQTLRGSIEGGKTVTCKICGTTAQRPATGQLPPGWRLHKGIGIVCPSDDKMLHQEAGADQTMLTPGSRQPVFGLAGPSTVRIHPHGESRVSTDSVLNQAFLILIDDLGISDLFEPHSSHESQVKRLSIEQTDEAETGYANVFKKYTTLPPPEIEPESVAHAQHVLHRQGYQPIHAERNPLGLSTVYEHPTKGKLTLRHDQGRIHSWEHAGQTSVVGKHAVSQLIVHLGKIHGSQNPNESVSANGVHQSESTAESLISDHDRLIIHAARNPDIHPTHQAWKSYTTGLDKLVRKTYEHVKKHCSRDCHHIPEMVHSAADSLEYARSHEDDNSADFALYHLHRVIEHLDKNHPEHEPSLIKAKQRSHESRVKHAERGSRNSLMDEATGLMNHVNYAHALAAKHGYSFNRNLSSERVSQFEKGRERFLVFHNKNQITQWKHLGKSGAPTQGTSPRGLESHLSRVHKSPVRSLVPAPAKSTKSLKTDTSNTSDEFNDLGRQHGFTFGSGKQRGNEYIHRREHADGSSITATVDKSRNVKHWHYISAGATKAVTGTHLNDLVAHMQSRKTRTNEADDSAYKAGDILNRQVAMKAGKVVKRPRQESMNEGFGAMLAEIFDRHGFDPGPTNFNPYHDLKTYGYGIKSPSTSSPNPLNRYAEPKSYPVRDETWDLGGSRSVSPYADTSNTLNRRAGLNLDSRNADQHATALHAQTEDDLEFPAHVAYGSAIQSAFEFMSLAEHYRLPPDIVVQLDSLTKVLYQAKDRTSSGKPIRNLGLESYRPILHRMQALIDNNPDPSLRRLGSIELEKLATSVDYLTR